MKLKGSDRQLCVCVRGWSNSESIWSVVVSLLYTYPVWLPSLFWLHFLLSLPPKGKRKTVDLKGELRTCSKLRERERMLSSMGRIMGLTNITGFLFMSDYLYEMGRLCVKVFGQGEPISHCCRFSISTYSARHNTVRFGGFSTRSTMAE